MEQNPRTILDVSGPEPYNKCWIKCVNFFQKLTHKRVNGGNQMALSKKPVNGMKDILPAEMEIRDYVTSVIKDTYRSFGFTPIETPCMENIANLSNKQGGENEKLIFKVLKRGEKLNLDTAKEEADVVDFGMRYDLTVPLSRFYANNANDLPSPFKALQIGGFPLHRNETGILNRNIMALMERAL